ncbi:MAG: DUF1559 domain-containing protein [Candidatus Omnitrophica bacterium]|nr:DUF1559 domain-containing protein [Candidatus Omnitrophota bacterium]
MARQVSCINNLKQLGLAFHLYFTDYNEDIPLAVGHGDATHGHKSWYVRIAPYIRPGFNATASAITNLKVFTCPSYRTAEGISAWYPRFAENYYWGNPDQPWRKLSSVKKPSQTMLLIEKSDITTPFRVYTGEISGITKAKQNRHLTGVTILFFDGRADFWTDSIPASDSDVFWSKPY